AAVKYLTSTPARFKEKSDWGCCKLNTVVHRHWSKKGVLLGLLAASLWGLTPAATKVALEGFSPELLGFLRLAIAAALFRVLAGNGARWFVSDVWIWTAGAGLGADFLLYNYGLQRTTANVAGLVINVEMISTI